MSHELFVRVDGSSLQVGCKCGVFLLDRGPGTSGFAQASLPEITGLIQMHYMQVKHPEQSNGTTKLIKGKR